MRLRRLPASGVLCSRSGRWIAAPHAPFSTSTPGGWDPLTGTSGKSRSRSDLDTERASPISASGRTSCTYDCVMTGSPAKNSAESITIELTTDQIHRLDDLRSERNLSRAELIG